MKRGDGQEVKARQGPVAGERALSPGRRSPGAERGALGVGGGLQSSAPHGAAGVRQRDSGKSAELGAQCQKRESLRTEP